MFKNVFVGRISLFQVFKYRSASEFGERTAFPAQLGKYVIRPLAVGCVRPLSAYAIIKYVCDVARPLRRQFSKPNRIPVNFVDGVPRSQSRVFRRYRSREGLVSGERCAHTG